ncbi:MAG: hypothetical protein V4640_01540 [Verrucomicrobiota bacterium]
MRFCETWLRVSKRLAAGLPCCASGAFVGAGFLFVSLAHAAPIAEFETPATLVAADGSTRAIELISAKGNSIRYRVDGALRDVEIQEGVAVSVPEPAEFSAGMDLYQGRNYQEARRRFAEVKKKYRPIAGMMDSLSTLAAFYEMECLRKVGDLAGLAEALKEFSKGPLSRDYQNRQLELYVLWDAVRIKDWEKVLTLAASRAGMRLPGDQRAQVACCEGFALEGLGRPDEALLSYQMAITADAGASEEITRQAALRILAIYAKDGEVTAALTGKGSGPAAGQVKLAQARAIVGLFELSFGNGTPLPAEFLKFRTAGASTKP